MGNFTRAKPTGWSQDDLLTPAQINKIDEQHVKAPNCSEGSEHEPTSDVVLKDAAHGLALLGDMTLGALQAQNWPWKDDQSSTFAGGPCLGYSPAMVESAAGTDIFREAYFAGDDAGALGFTTSPFGSQWFTGLSVTSMTATKDFVWAPGFNSGEGYMLVCGPTAAGYAAPNVATGIAFSAASGSFTEAPELLAYTVASGSPKAILITVAGGAGPYGYYSSNGTSWTAAGAIPGATGETPRGLAANETGTVIAAYTNSKGARSTDGGVTWSALSVPTPKDRGLAYSPKLDMWMLLNDVSNLVYISTDDGDTWTTTGAFFDASEDQHHLVVLGRLWVCCSGEATGELLYSLDEGVSWHRAGADDDAQALVDLIVASGRLVTCDAQPILYHSLRAGRETTKPGSS